MPCVPSNQAGVREPRTRFLALNPLASSSTAFNHRDPVSGIRPDLLAQTLLFSVSHEGSKVGAVRATPFPTAPCAFTFCGALTRTERVASRIVMMDRCTRPTLFGRTSSLCKVLMRQLETPMPKSDSQIGAHGVQKPNDRSFGQDGQKGNKASRHSACFSGP